MGVGERSFNAVGKPVEQNLLDKKGLQLKLFRFLLLKYASIIEDFEKKTVGEIKALVDKDDLSIQSIVQEFKAIDFVFEKDFLVSARKAFEFVQKEIVFIKPEISLNFWLSPKEILQEKIGDDKDLAIFLCALLYALEDRECQVIVAELSDGSSHAFVCTEFGGNFFIFDPSQKHEFAQFCGKKETVLENFSFNSAKISRFLFRFNRHNYEQFSEIL